MCCCGNVFTGPLPRNGSGISAHLAVVAWQRLYALQYELVTKLTKTDIIELSRYSDGLRDGRMGFDWRQRQGIFLYSTAFRSALEATQPSIKWVPEALFPGVKQPGREACHLLPCRDDVKNGGAIPPYPHTSSWRRV
jgi:hypothetical protein